jgi:hypothetical protein
MYQGFAARAGAAVTVVGAIEFTPSWSLLIQAKIRRGWYRRF